MVNDNDVNLYNLENQGNVNVMRSLDFLEGHF